MVLQDLCRALALRVTVGSLDHVGTHVDALGWRKVQPLCIACGGCAVAKGASNYRLAGDKRQTYGKQRQKQKRAVRPFLA